MPFDPIIYAIIGRLWGYVSNSRFMNYHGEDHCRLDRSTRVLACEEEKVPVVMRFIASTVLFGCPETVRLQLNEQLVDGLVIERVWLTFISAKTTEWRQLMQWMIAPIMYVRLLLIPCPAADEPQHKRVGGYSVSYSCPLVQLSRNLLCRLALVCSSFSTPSLPRERHR